MNPHALADHTWKLTHGGAEPTLVSRNRFARHQAETAIHHNLPNPGLRLAAEAIPKPLGWGRSQHVLVDVDSDLFHPHVPLAFQSLVWATMALAGWHTFLLLTQHPALQRSTAALFNRQPLPNVWLGVQANRRTQVVPRLEELRNTPAAVRFLSLDPLLEDLGTLDLEGIDWVIVGGASDPRERRLDARWVHSIHHQCLLLGVPFYFKEWGGCPAARVLDGRLWNERPPRPQDTPPPPIQRQRLRRKIRQAVAYLYPNGGFEP